MNFKPLDNYLDTFYKEKNIPGVGISIYRHGKHLHTYCAGYANVEERVPFAPDTMISLCSATKVSTATAAMKLVERGLMDLEDLVEKYLPEMADVRVQQSDGTLAAPKNIMRIRHLLSMTAGFGYDRSSAAVQKLMEETGGNPTTRQYVSVLAQTPLLFEPGTHFKYSVCHDVLGAVLEVVCQKSFGEILREEIFDPIGMKDVTFHLNEEQRKRLAPEYSNFNGTTETADKVAYRRDGQGMGSRYESGGGGLISCLQDYVLLPATLANGGVAPNGKQIIKPETIRMMQKSQLNSDAQQDFDQFSGWFRAGYSYGLGVRTLLDRERNNSLSENGEIGWDGAMGCYLAADPKSGVAIFYTQQETVSHWYKYHGMIRNYAYACVLGAE